MMLRGLSKLTWLEIKIFVREPLGMFGAILVPVMVFVVLGRVIGGRVSAPAPEVSGLNSINGVNVPVVGFTFALLVSTLSILSIGFVIASIVPTARFAQPIAGGILYPMIAVSGLFAPIESLPPAVQTVARLLPMTYAVSLLKGIWTGDSWAAHLGDVAALVVVMVVCLALSAKVFRWE